jgi:hypothetical protein
VRLPSAILAGNSATGEEFMAYDCKRIILPTPDGPIELTVYTVSGPADADLRAWNALGDFEPVELPDPELS